MSPHLGAKLNRTLISGGDYAGPKRGHPTQEPGIIVRRFRMTVRQLRDLREGVFSTDHLRTPLAVVPAQPFSCHKAA